MNVCQDEGHEVDELDLVNKVDDRVDDEIIADDDVGPSRLVVYRRHGRRGGRRCRPHRGAEISDLVDQFDE